MRWVRFTADGNTAYGSVTGDTVTEIAGEPWGDAVPNGVVHALGDVKIEVPVIPKTFYCAGINYAAHIREMAHSAGWNRCFRPRPILATGPITLWWRMGRMW